MEPVSKGDTVEPPVQDHPKLEVSYWSRKKVVTSINIGFSTEIDDDFLSIVIDLVKR